MRPPHATRTKERDPGSSRGFSLIELLIVVAIILIIAAIAIPNLLRSRMAANDASAVGSVRTINTAEVNYVSTYNDGYSNSLVFLGGAAGAAPTCNNAEIVDPILSASNASIKSGYNFTAGPGTVQVTAAPAGCGQKGYLDGYTIIAWPVNAGTTGQRSFCSDGTGVIQYLSTGVQPAPAAPFCAGMTGPISQ